MATALFKFLIADRNLHSVSILLSRNPDTRPEIPTKKLIIR